jgi:nicotinate-nucleotide pyrophosphorylase (carboxylating)
MDDQKIITFLEEALKEDVGTGDHTSNACINPDSTSKAELLLKDTGTIAGIEFAKFVFHHLEPEMTFTPFLHDGEDVHFGDVAFHIECNTQNLLKVERLLLNTMQRMSGIATLASRFAVEIEGMDVKILDTRKTTPLIRFLEKWAVTIGGCHNYRDGLYDWIMIKDNHIDACGSIKAAIEHVHNYLKQHHLDLGITVEVRNLVELEQVLKVGGITRIMMDNFEIPLLREAISLIDARFESEASGGINLNNVRLYAETGVNFISVGALTHSAGTLDMSLNIL